MEKNKGGGDRVAYVPERAKQHCLLQKKKREYEQNKSDDLKPKLYDQQSF